MKRKHLYFHIPKPGHGSTTYCGRVERFPTNDYDHVRRCADKAPQDFCGHCVRRREAEGTDGPLTREQQRAVVVDECERLAWDSRPLAIGSDGRLTDGAAWEFAKKTESALRRQVREWNG
jgi:hypothetical protein